tara:strand:- start:305 stop:523 length:219 start_codon:yes stop_codon:yes gene_type:complete
MKTELERLEKLALDAKVAYKAAMTLFPNAEYYNNLDELEACNIILEACNTTYAAWFKLELELSNYLKEQDDE